jgi:cytochrome c
MRSDCARGEHDASGPCPGGGSACIEDALRNGVSGTGHFARFRPASLGDLPAPGGGGIYRAIAAILVFLLLPYTARAADAEHGKVVFQTCAACHSDKPDAIGPSLRGVYGRKSGSLDNFRYSNAMLRANLIWDEANLRAYLEDPQAKVRGNRMPFAGLTDPKDIDDVIAYLKEYK